MIRNGGSQIIQYYVWVNNIWKYNYLWVLEQLVILVGCKIRAYFRKIKHPGIKCFVKVPFLKKKKILIDLNQKCPKQLPMRGYSIFTYPSWLSKCPFVKQSSPFIEAKNPFPRIISLNSFILNNFSIFRIFLLKCFYHIFHMFHILLPLFSGKNSIFNCVSKLNFLSFYLLTHISLQFWKFYS